MTNTEEFTDLGKYNIVKEIAKGKYGIVYTIEERDTGKIYAAKITKEPLDNSNKSLELNLEREVNLMSQLNHPSILKFIGYSPIDFNSNPKPVIITEYSKYGSLDHIIDLEKKAKAPDLWNDTQKLINIYGIASAMSYLHSNEIIHRDLKPENILENDDLCPLIADFGLSKSFKNTENTIKSQLCIKGTLTYIPPEVYITSESTKESDVYAFAMIVYEIFTLEKPFQKFKGGYFQLMEAVTSGERPEFNVLVPDRFKKLIEDCWSQDPKERPTFESIVNQLKNDRQFITEFINEEKFKDYIELIDKSSPSYNPHKKFVQIKSSNSILFSNFEDDGKLITLNVRAIRATDLMKMNFGTTDKPYLTLRLKSSQNKDEILRTRTIKNTLNPNWNEYFSFVGIKKSDSLIINMYDEESRKIGYKMMNEISIPVPEIIINGGKIDQKEIEIEYKEYKRAGKLYLGLSTNETKRGHLKIHVFDGKDLKRFIGLIQMGKPDAMMSFAIKNLNGLQAKTNVYFSNSDPVWNQDFVIEVPDINVNYLVISLLDKSRVMYEKEVKLADLKINKKNVYNEKIYYQKKELGVIHYGYELCAGYPKTSTNDTKIYSFHK